MQKQSSEKTKHKIKSKNKNQSKTKNRPTDVTSKEYQVARAFLRERTLRLLSGIAGKKCEMLTIESTIVTGEFKGCDINVQEFFIKNLRTPVSSIPDAVVRDQDIVKICVPNIMCDSE